MAEKKWKLLKELLDIAKTVPPGELAAKVSFVGGFHCGVESSLTAPRERLCRRGSRISRSKTTFKSVDITSGRRCWTPWRPERCDGSGRLGTLARVGDGMEREPSGGDDEQKQSADADGLKAWKVDVACSTNPDVIVIHPDLHGVYNLPVQTAESLRLSEPWSSKASHISIRSASGL
jgi:hypothetical protein